MERMAISKNSSIEIMSIISIGLGMPPYASADAAYFPTTVLWRPQKSHDNGFESIVYIESLAKGLITPGEYETTPSEACNELEWPLFKKK